MLFRPSGRTAAHLDLDGVANCLSHPVDSMAELVLKLKPASPPLTPILTLCLGCAAFGAITQIVQGLWEMLILPRQKERQGPVLMPIRL